MLVPGLAILLICLLNFTEKATEIESELYVYSPDGKDTNLWLSVDPGLPASDSMLMSQRFVDRIRNRNGFFVIQDSTLKFDENRYRTVPTLLPFNKIVSYQAEKDSVRYQLYLKRINLTDVEWAMIAEKAGGILQHARDTVIYDVYGGGSLTDKYGFHYNGYRYSSPDKKNYTELKLTRDFKIYATFIYVDHLNPEKNLFKNGLFLTRTDVEPPYHYFLKSTIERMCGGYAPEDNLKRYSTFKLLMSDIRLNCSDAEIYKDTMLMDDALYYCMDSVITMLRGNGFAERKVSTSLEYHRFSAEEFHHFGGTLFFNSNKEVRSRDFEEINFDAENGMRSFQKGPYIIGYKEFNNTFYREATCDLIYFKNKIIALLADEGFEGINFIITIWEKEGEYYILKGILDKMITSAIGNVQIDTVIEYDEHRNFIIGTTSGGDAGDSWGSVWIGVWELPAGLKIVFHQYWAELYDGEHTSLSYRFVNPGEIELFRKEYVFSEDEKNRSITDSISKTSCILLDSLVDKEHIKQTR